MDKIIDGKAIAAKIREEIAAGVVMLKVAADYAGTGRGFGR